MANSVPFRTSPQLGPQLNEKFTALPYWDALAGITIPSYKPRNKEVGDDGHDYIWVQASAAIAATPTTGTQVTLTETATNATVATGAGGYYTLPGVAYANGDWFHVRKGAIGSP